MRTLKSFILKDSKATFTLIYVLIVYILFVKGTVMKIEKALINDRLRVSKVS